MFAAAEAVLYAAFLLLDLTGSAPPVSDFLKYVSVVLCFLWRLGRKDAALTAAQLLVLAADFFLLFTGRFILGILVFLAVQLCYRLFLTERTLRRRFVFLWALCLAVACLLIRAAKTDAVMTLAVLYAVFLLWNTATALRRGGRVFAAGLVLLILCDVNVALWNLPSPPILPALRAFAGTGMWLFYLPSQVFVAFSAARRGQNPPERPQNRPQ